MYLTIDVETNGLHGEAFAAGWVLTNEDGETIIEGMAACRYNQAKPDKLDRTPAQTEAFLKEHVIPVVTPLDCPTPAMVRDRFVEAFADAVRYARNHSATVTLVADVPYPCETGFLAKCRAEHGNAMPDVYPLLDVASMLKAAGYDPLGTYPRQENELPAHNPLHDARQSSRILHTILKDSRRDDGDLYFGE